MKTDRIRQNNWYLRDYYGGGVRTLHSADSQAMGKFSHYLADICPGTVRLPSGLEKGRTGSASLSPSGSGGGAGLSE